MEFERLELLIGNKINDIKNKKVLVIGLGGVGGYTAVSLVRNGIKNITIVDFDTIDISNINRQIIAFHSTIGENKTDALERMLLDINPDCLVTKYTMKVNEDNINELFRVDYDYVVDAIDDINMKCNIISICKENKIKLISSMGTGNKIDPTKLKICDIRKTSYDPIARKIRRYVKDNRIKGKVYVVSSDENKYTEPKDFIPTNSYVPSIAGLLITSCIINDIIGEVCLKN